MVIPLLALKGNDLIYLMTGLKLTYFWLKKFMGNPWISKPESTGNPWISLKSVDFIRKTILDDRPETRAILVDTIHGNLYISKSESLPH